MLILVDLLPGEEKLCEKLVKKQNWSQTPAECKPREIEFGWHWALTATIVCGLKYVYVYIASSRLLELRKPELGW